VGVRHGDEQVSKSGRGAWSDAKRGKVEIVCEM